MHPPGWESREKGRIAQNDLGSICAEGLSYWIALLVSFLVFLGFEDTGHLVAEVVMLLMKRFRHLEEEGHQGQALVVFSIKVELIAAHKERLERLEESLNTSQEL